MRFPLRTDRVAAATAFFAIVSACAEHGVAPIVTPAAPAAELIEIGSLVAKRDTHVTLIVVNPLVSGDYSIGGGHRLWIRAGGICELTAEYGVGTWDLPCVSALLPTVITARSWIEKGGRPRVEFTPALRFVPLQSVASAMLYLQDNAGAVNPASVIKYCDGATCTNEGANDPSLVTMHDKQSGYVYRRIKHFSGYQVSTGRQDELEPAP